MSPSDAPSAKREAIQLSIATLKTSTPLLNSPTEILDRVLSFIVGSANTKIDLHTYSPIIPTRMKLGHNCPYRLADLMSLITAYPELNNVAGSYIARSFVFRNDGGDKIDRIPFLYGPGICSHIQQFELRLAMNMLLHHKHYWPMALETIARDLPNLRRFRIYRESSTQPPYDMDAADFWAEPSTESERVERTLRRFAAFALHMDPKLDIMFRPANSGLAVRAGYFECSYVLQKHQPRKWERLVVSRDTGLPVAAEALDAVVVSDRIINAALARTFLSTEGCKINIDDLVIQPDRGSSLDDIETSDVITDDHEGYFGEVDRAGYRVKGRAPYQVWRKFRDGQDVDDMIKRARRQQNRDVADIHALEVGLNDILWFE